MTSKQDLDRILLLISISAALFLVARKKKAAIDDVIHQLSKTINASQPKRFIQVSRDF